MINTFKFYLCHNLIIFSTIFFPIAIAWVSNINTFKRRSFDVTTNCCLYFFFCLATSIFFYCYFQICAVVRIWMIDKCEQSKCNIDRSKKTVTKYVSIENSSALYLLYFSISFMGMCDFYALTRWLNPFWKKRNLFNHVNIFENKRHSNSMPKCQRLIYLCVAVVVCYFIPF